MGPAGVSKFLSLRPNVRVDNPLGRSILNQLDGGHEIGVCADQQRRVEQVVYGCLDQIRDQRRVDPLLNGAVNWTLTVRTLSYRLPAVRMWALLGSGRLTFAYGNPVSGKSVHDVEEPAQPAIRGVLRIH